MKTSKLEGAALDWAAAKAKGFADFVLDPKRFLEMHETGHYNYSTEWAQGGPIIEREKMKVYPNVGGRWSAQITHTKSHPLVTHPVIDGWSRGAGETPLIAAMRCYVASKLGDEVETPDELNETDA